MATTRSAAVLTEAVKTGRRRATRARVQPRRRVYGKGATTSRRLPSRSTPAFTVLACITRLSGNFESMMAVAISHTSVAPRWRQLLESICVRVVFLSLSVGVLLPATLPVTCARATAQTKARIVSITPRVVTGHGVSPGPKTESVPWRVTLVVWLLSFGSLHLFQGEGSPLGFLSAFAPHGAHFKAEHALTLGTMLVHSVSIKAVLLHPQGYPPPTTAFVSRGCALLRLDFRDFASSPSKGTPHMMTQGDP